MAEILFYQLQRQPLEAVLPTLILRSREKGWRVAVQGATEERLALLDDLLWTFSEESFLPHGLDGRDNPVDQPILLTVRPDNRNGAAIRFLIEGVMEPDDVASYQRLVVLFDGRYEENLVKAREQWKRLKEAGHAVTYWQQNPEGRWERKA